MPFERNYTCVMLKIRQLGWSDPQKVRQWLMNNWGKLWIIEYFSWNRGCAGLLCSSSSSSSPSSFLEHLIHLVETQIIPVATFKPHWAEARLSSFIFKFTIILRSFYWRENCSFSPSHPSSLSQAAMIQQNAAPLPPSVSPAQKYTPPTRDILLILKCRTWD